MMKFGARMHDTSRRKYVLSHVDPCFPKEVNMLG